MTETEEKICATIVDKAIDFVEWMRKEERRNKMPEEKESLCRKCEMWAEMKCASNPETHIIGRCRIAPWDSAISEIDIVVECPDFEKKE